MALPRTSPLHELSTIGNAIAGSISFIMVGGIGFGIINAFNPSFITGIYWKLGSHAKPWITETRKANSSGLSVFLSHFFSSIPVVIPWCYFETPHGEPTPWCSDWNALFILVTSSKYYRLVEAVLVLLFLVAILYLSGTTHCSKSLSRSVISQWFISLIRQGMDDGFAKWFLYL